MTENIEELTKSLTSIINALNNLVSKNNAPVTLVQAESGRIKKTPDMTYLDFLTKALANRPPV